MEFVEIFWTNNIQEAYLPKTSIVGQIVSEILAQLCSDDSIQSFPKNPGTPSPYRTPGLLKKQINTQVRFQFNSL